MQLNQKSKPVVLCILDGWGQSEKKENNAIAMAQTPNYNHLINNHPHALLATSGSDVGLPDGQMGNSEVGHMNLGGGRVVMQDLPRIDAAIKDDSLKNKAALEKLITTLKKSGGACHLMGLMSPGGVHSHQDHIVALARILTQENIPIKLHAFLDGRDTPPQSAIDYMTRLEKSIAALKNVDVATVSGRYFAMDRDKRWDRVEKAYDTIALGQGRRGENPIKSIEAAYKNNETDEFFIPTLFNGYSGIQKGDGLLMANFRADRAREILTTLLVGDFSGFKRKSYRPLTAAVGLVEYSNALNPYIEAMFSPISVENNLGQVVSHAGLKQLRIAETEKYAHVTFFFNGGSEDVFNGEDRILIPSPNVATYDLKPEMSAYELTDTLVEKIKHGGYDLIVVNFANPDMVGHTGIISAAIKAVETIDTCLGKIITALKTTDGAMLITADHGNVEQMKDYITNEPHTAHTTLEVPVILWCASEQNIKLKNGCLADIAPTVLELMNIKQPKEMTGKSLIKGSA